MLVTAQGPSICTSSILNWHPRRLWHTPSWLHSAVGSCIAPHPLGAAPPDLALVFCMTSGVLMPCRFRPNPSPAGGVWPTAPGRHSSECNWSWWQPASTHDSKCFECFEWWGVANSTREALE